MSKIIKSQDLIVKEPIKIESIFDKTTQDLLASEKAAFKSVMAETGEQLYKGESSGSNLELVREEADRILHETESMIVELMDKARSEALSIIEEAREEAQEIRKAAEEEARRIREEAASRGYQEGYQQAMQETEAERMRAIEESEQMIQEAVRQRNEILNSSEEMMVRLVMAVARKIVEKEVEQNPDIIINLVKNALDLVGSADSVKIIVSPRDFEYLLNQQMYLTGPGQGAGGMDLHTDIRITPGGCLVESETGTVDARLETRIQNIENALLDVAGREER